jgi:hypothetical protein
MTKRTPINAVRHTVGINLDSIVLLDLEDSAHRAGRSSQTVPDSEGTTQVESIANAASQVVGRGFRL